MADRTDRALGAWVWFPILLLLAGTFVGCSWWARGDAGAGRSTVFFHKEGIPLPRDVTAASCARAASDARKEERAALPVAPDGGVASTENECSFEPATAASDVPPMVFASKPGLYRIQTQVNGAAGREYSARIAPMLPGMLVGALLVLLLIAGPLLIRSATGHHFSWSELLSEKGGGYSLSKVQLLIWFAPALFILTAVACVKLDDMSIPPTFAVLLGLAGATTALGLASTPSVIRTSTLGAAPASQFPQNASSYQGNTAQQPATASAAQAPNLNDLVTDWNNQGDFSRYQYLLLSLVGAFMLVSAFVLEGRIVEVPKEFLAIIGASQATYLGTKAFKTSKTETANAQGTGT